MPDKKLTDSEIVKALECCIKGDCENCNREWSYNNQWDCMRHIQRLSLDLINHLQTLDKNNENIIRLADKTIETQNAEIERLKEVNDSFTDIGKLYSEIKAEAYKEVFEKLKDKSIVCKVKLYGKGKFFPCLSAVTLHDIKSLEKEFVGENDDTQS